tara:strand:- start:29 stop:298 length:270 start_codon:yes stop_codon:yes gene_type:complete
MKLFLYKTLIITFVIFVLFEITIGYRINNIKGEFEKFISMQNKDEILVKVKDEIKKANEKEYILDQEERELLSTFINKIRNELRLANTK